MKEGKVLLGSHVSESALLITMPRHVFKSH